MNINEREKKILYFFASFSDLPLQPFCTYYFFFLLFLEREIKNTHNNWAKKCEQISILIKM